MHANIDLVKIVAGVPAGVPEDVGGAHPEALLVPMLGAREDDTATIVDGVPRQVKRTPCTNLQPRRTEDFVIQQLFRRRPWRPNPGGRSGGTYTPDY